MSMLQVTLRQMHERVLRLHGDIMQLQLLGGRDALAQSDRSRQMFMADISG